jgi:hypothetical protein
MHDAIDPGGKLLGGMIDMAGHIGKMGDQRAAERDVDHLDPPTDRQGRHLDLERSPHHMDLEAILIRVDAVDGGMRIGAVACRIDIGPTHQQHPVESLEKGTGLGMVDPAHRGVRRPRSKEAATWRSTLVPHPGAQHLDASIRWFDQLVKCLR